MLQRFKSAARDALPAQFQVPVKYWYGALRRDLEPEMALLPLLVRKGAHVADVGGNRGTYAYCFHRLGARVEIFEPNPLCADILDRWARPIASATVHRVALSSAAGLATLHIPIDEQGVEHDASASIETPGSGRQHDIEVPLRDLDSYGFDDLDFIKIDTEGHEGSVLAGASATIRASYPAMLIEIEQRHLGAEPIGSLFERILAMGYRGYYLLGQRLEPLAGFDPARDQSMIAFETKSGRYINNFLFLAETRIKSGAYQDVLSRWTAP